MDLRRWALVGYLIVLMVFCLSFLARTSRIPGATTSDSGFFWGLAEEIEKTNGMLESYYRSHPPPGLPVDLVHQGQPLMAVMLYRGLNTIAPGLTLEDVIRYLPPLFFSLLLIPVFLIGRELAGNLGGGAAALFLALMWSGTGTTSPLYWSKVGAFDREALQALLTAWAVFATLKLFKAERKLVLEHAVAAGLVYGVFALVWPGYLYLVPVILGGVVLILINDTFNAFTKLGWKLSSILKGVRWNLALILGVVVMFAVTSLVALNFEAPTVSARVASAGAALLGLAKPRYPLPVFASEMQPVRNWGQSLQGFYGPGLLTVVVFTLLAVALLKILWSRRRQELFMLAWMVVLILMARSQLRFLRLWWSFLAPMAGLGLAALLTWVRKLSAPAWSAGLLAVLRRPIGVAVVVVLLTIPVAARAESEVGRTGPPMRLELHNGFYDGAIWLRENSPENSVFAVQWSYGHLIAGISRRVGLVDGVQTIGWEGEWENNPNILVRPPDYIFRKREGLPALLVGGRRPDVDSFFSIDSSEELFDLVRRYRDEYGVRIDYIIFDLGTVFSGIQSAAAGAPVKAVSQTSARDGNRIVLGFGENRENVVLDLGTGSVYLRRDNQQIGLAGYLIYRVRGQRAWLENFGFFPEPQLEETLLIFLDEREQVREGRLLELSTPFGVRVFSREFFGIDYLRGTEPIEVVWSSRPDRQGWVWVKICKINHEPSLTAPSDATITNQSTVTLSWAPVLDAENYEVWVDNDLDFGSPQVRRTFPHPVLQGSFQLPDGDYFWKVVVYGPENEVIGHSQVWTLTVDTSPPGVPQLLSPENRSALKDNTPALDWEDVEDAVRYQVEVDNNPEFQSPEVRAMVTESAYTLVTPLREGEYYWRVRAFDRANNAGEFSPPWMFRITS